jgi:multisubunit Na+/H+ antiporter MnhE subunit
MGLYSSPPAAQTRLDSNPTLLMSWWATGFAFAIIVVRVLGRYIRTKRLFPDDWVMLLSILPLLIRMGLIHVVLLFGTNNAISDGFTEQDIRQRELGSKLVLAARIFYALL